MAAVAEGVVAEGVVAAVAEVVAAVAEGVVAAVAEGHHQIGRTMIWDHFHRGTGIPRLPG